MFLGTQALYSPNNLLIAAYSQSYWKTMESAFNALQNCFNFKTIIVPSQAQVLEFISWGYKEKNWKYATVNSYISCLNTLFKLKNVNTNVFNSYTTKTALKGVRNLDEINANCKRIRKVFSLPLLKILGHSIANSEWDEMSKRIMWTLSCVMFFGSFRISELLSKYEYSFDPITTLLWGDVKFNVDSVRIILKSPKVYVQGGVSVDLFKIENQSFCPVNCLVGLRDCVQSAGQNSPVFMFKNGKLLTPSIFNRTLRELLKSELGHESEYFSSHSFRAAIPAMLAEHPNVASQEAIMGWGRWDSKAYEKYTRLKLNKRKETFNTICTLFSI
jgi:hypothetical protein